MENEKSNSVINALKRLERIGQENSDTINKIKTAVDQVMETLAKMAHDEQLEKIDIEIREENSVKYNVGIKFQNGLGGICAINKTCSEPILCYLHSFIYSPALDKNPTQVTNPKNRLNREIALDFAKLIAEYDLLDKIVSEFEKILSNNKQLEKNIKEKLEKIGI
jgi:hypothetical protein